MIIYIVTSREPFPLSFLCFFRTSKIQRIYKVTAESTEAWTRFCIWNTNARYLPGPLESFFTFFFYKRKKKTLILHVDTNTIQPVNCGSHVTVHHIVCFFWTSPDVTSWVHDTPDCAMWLNSQFKILPFCLKKKASYSLNAFTRRNSRFSLMFYAGGE